MVAAMIWSIIYMVAELRNILGILRSDSDPSRYYVGRATDVDQRLEWHNAGPCGYTLQHRPWSPVVSLEFPNERSAAHFEKYLKSGSGRAFAKRHFAPVEQAQSL